MIRWEHLRFSFSLEGEPVQFREFDQGRALVCCELFSLPPNPQLLLDDFLRAQHLVLQLDVIWYQSRQTSRSVSSLDIRLTEMRNAPDEHCELAEAKAGHRFYRDMAQENSPQLLLTDLKGQLELLANRLSHESEKL